MARELPPTPPATTRTSPTSRASEAVSPTPIVRMPSPTATAVTTAAAPQQKATAIFTDRRPPGWRKRRASGRPPAWRSPWSSARPAAARALTGQKNPWATWSSSRRVEVIAALVEGGASVPGVRARRARESRLVPRLPEAASCRGVRPAATQRRHFSHNRVSDRRARAQRAPHGHEHLGGVHAALIAPGAGAMAQRVERARVRIGAHLALVAGHGRDLLLERRRDVHPGVRDE